MSPVAETSAFGAMVQDLRKEKGWSQQDLATAADLSLGYIGGIESGHRGQRPSREVVLAIARALDCDPYPLLVAAGRNRPDDEPKVRSTRPTFEAFVTGDPLLKAAEREMLIRLYRSYVGERGRR